VLFEKWIINIEVSHIIIPLWIMWVQKHSLQWELWANSLNNIKEIKHLLNRFVSLLSHASVFLNSY